MKQKVIVYALGKIWTSKWKYIMEHFDVIACSDKNISKKDICHGISFVEPSKIDSIHYDYILLGSIAPGMKEQIANEYNIDINKIVYLRDTISTNYSITKDDFTLTVVIPTYNRKERLLRTLKLLEKQTNSNFKVIVLDNASNYDVNELIGEFEEDFSYRIEIRKNLFNIGMHGNLANVFIQTKGYIWTLSDDDIPSKNAIEKVRYYISQNRECGALHFSINDMSAYMHEDRYLKFDSMSELVRFFTGIYDKEGTVGPYGGDLIYLSNKVYNMDIIGNYVDKAFCFSYTGIPQIIPLWYMLIDKIGKYCFINDDIVMHDNGSDVHWDWGKVALGMSTITDIDFELANYELKMLYRMYMLEYKTVFENCEYDSIRRKQLMNVLYHRIYSLYLNDEEMVEIGDMI